MAENMIKMDARSMAAARDKRQSVQKQWQKRLPYPLLSFTLNTPGPVKSSALYDRIHNEGIRLISKALSSSIIAVWVHRPPSGPEAYIALKGSAEALKGALVQIEEESPAGRLFDMDLLDSEGRIVSRRDCGLPARKCLICNKEAVICSRSRAHSLSELTEEIKRLASLLPCRH